MITHKPSTLAEFQARLLGSGRGVFTAEEAQSALGIGRGAFLDAAERLQRRGELIRLRRGFYVIVPPQEAAVGAPPPEWYIDALMQHENGRYYVGLLTAASAHGASHQAVMTLQVITDKRIPSVEAGRTRIDFTYRKEMAAVEMGVEEGKAPSGYLKRSSPELTALDLVRYPDDGAGLDNIATVLSELASQLNPQKLAKLSDAFEKPVVQRLGYLLDRLGYEEITAAMLRSLEARGRLFWVELSTPQSPDADLSPQVSERNDRWHVIVRLPPEVDE
jgi:predicted transcriptional regulator of viral defense system